LKRAAQGCFDIATAFETPFISGKDSMFNDFSGFDADSNPVKVSVLPTLLISSIGIHPDIAAAVSMDAKCDGDLVYVIGDTSDEMGGSEYYASLGYTGKTVPSLDAKKAKMRYGRLTDAIGRGLVASAYAVNYGGLGVALAKVAIAGNLGMDLVIPSAIRADFYLFSESLGRFIVTVAPEKRDLFEDVCGTDATLVGFAGGKKFRIAARQKLIDMPVDEMENAYRLPFRGY
jgi:phosphoribosylformylglycinamidine synthase